MAAETETFAWGEDRLARRARTASRAFSHQVRSSETNHPSHLMRKCSAAVLTSIKRVNAHPGGLHEEEGVHETGTLRLFTRTYALLNRLDHYRHLAYMS